LHDSYPVRTHVSGFDPSFNAITGLNGSGKSNILDSICFVLGITNLSAVRAANLQDLIYKRGQAGITKASVTIVFDNSDRSKSPVSFENYAQITVTRQIAMGGLSKYLINGHKATQQAVQNMFQSVQLNINNPNFLIMQGKITKVLNMKPAEILSMIEEAAGTRMFEDRKEKAIKTMSKKDQKVKEINALLDEEITPKLDKLREEKRSFLEYQRATTELERLTRLAKAFDWQQLRERNAEKARAVEDLTAQIATRKTEEEALTHQIAEIEKEIAEIEKKRDHDLKKGGKLPALIEESKRLAHEIVKENTQVDFKVASIEEEEKRIAADEKSLKALQLTRKEKTKKLETLRVTFDQLKADFDALNEGLTKQDELLQTLLTGMAAKNDESEKARQGGYMGQLAEAREQEASAGAEIEQSNLRVKHLEKELKTKEPQAKKAERDNVGLMQELENARKTVAQLESKMTATGWDEGKEKELLGRRADLMKHVNDLLEHRDRLKSRLAGMDFSYSDPEPNFDRSKVKGLVASLVQLDQGREPFSTALEICAGARLYNVVVEDERTGSQLLTNGRLKKRVTLIPLNKISATVAAAQRIGAAQRIAPGKVDLALTLIGYEDEVSAAMEYVFGNTLICADAETAKRVTFDNSVRMKSVTLDGDVYDPAGTLSGGSQPSSAGILVKVQELSRIEQELNEAKRGVQACEHEANAAKETVAAFNKLKRQLDLQQHQVSLLENQVQGSNATRIIAEVEAHKASVVGLKRAIEEAKGKRQEAAKECKRLEKEMEEFNANKDNKLEELRADIKARKADVQSKSATIKARQNEVRTLELELEDNDKESEAAQTGIEQSRAALDVSKAELNTMRAAVETLQAEVEKVDSAISAERKTLNAYDDEIGSLRNAIKQKKQEIADGQLALKQYTHEMEKAQQECSLAEKAVQQLEEQFGWILDEQELFGRPGTAYDFGKHNMNEVRRTCRKLEEQQTGMKQRVNPKVLNLIDSVEKKEFELKTMMSTVLKDKGKIEDTIKELDRYKEDALKTTWEKVNGDFGEIFAELLPGNYCKLEPPEGQSVTQGLEVKVRLGSVWKQSLTELSGGQRSLIALSLIMSLLQFKPAPMYILDEIDAALDLSHTQHIGQLFQSRFSGSQFIVVSLKEGLFTNANVLFRARFRDGTSIVERTTQRNAATASAAAAAAVLQQRESNRPALAGGRAGSGTGTKASSRHATTAV
jgi:structural maintenance of chromosome 2